jgi:hypothetical protein
MIKDIYVVNYTEHFIDGDGISVTNRGVCEYGYTNEEDAIQKVYELTDEKMNDNLDFVNMGRCYRDSNDNGDWQMVTVKITSTDDTYEYWVSKIGVEV